MRAGASQLPDENVFAACFLVFLLIAFGLSRMFAGGFMFDSVIITISGTTSVNVVTHANLSTTASARSSSRSGAYVPFRAGAVIDS